MTTFNVATLNIAGSRNPDAVRQLRYKHNISVMGLQEVDRNAKRSEYRDVAREIAAHDAKWAYSSSMRFGHLKRASETPDYKAPATGTDDDAHYGVALISTLPFKHERIHLGPDGDYWSVTDRKAQREIEPRSAIAATVAVGNKNVYFVLAHTAYTEDRSQSSPVRVAQLKTLEDYIESYIPPWAPLIAMGDFNATPENPDMEYFTRNFKTASVLTYPVHEDKMPDRQIDYIFYRNLEAAGDLYTYLDPSVADHALLVASFKL